MALLYTLLIGLVVGAIAKFLMPGNDPGGWLITILLGIAGAFVGTFLGRALGLYTEGQAAGWIASVIGAMVLLLGVSAHHRTPNHGVIRIGRVGRSAGAPPRDLAERPAAIPGDPLRQTHFATRHPVRQKDASLASRSGLSPPRIAGAIALNIAIATKSTRLSTG